MRFVLLIFLLGADGSSQMQAIDYSSQRNCEDAAATIAQAIAPEVEGKEVSVKALCLDRGRAY